MAWLVLRSAYHDRLDVLACDARFAREERRKGSLSDLLTPSLSHV